VTRDGILSLRPILPPHWTGLTFRIAFRGRWLEVRVTPTGTELVRLSGAPLTVRLDGRAVRLA
jgi:trehalose/maltose hydrolase-like predicted phosphorylase